MKWILSISSCRQKGPDFPLSFPTKESPVRYTPRPPMTALTSLLLTSLLPLGSTGQVIWLPPNFEVQVLAGEFVSTETGGRAPRYLASLWKKTGQETFKSPILSCSAPALPARHGCGLQRWHGATPWMCRADKCIATGKVRETHIPSWKTTTASFIVTISALRHRHYCLSSNLAYFPDYQQTVRGSSFLWKVKGN